MSSSTLRRYDRERLSALRTRGASSLVTPPEVEPVDVDALKRHSRLPNSSIDLDLLPLRLQAAREWVESYTGRALIRQTWAYTVDWFHDWTAPILLPKVPGIDVTSVAYVTQAGVSTPVSSSDYLVEAASGRLSLVTSGYWATDVRGYGGFTVTYRAGYGPEPEDVPAVFRLAIMLLAAEWTERLEATTDLKLAEIPLGVTDLLAPHVVAA